MPDNSTNRSKSSQFFSCISISKDEIFSFGNNPLPLMYYVVIKNKQGNAVARNLDGNNKTWKPCGKKMSIDFLPSSTPVNFYSFSTLLSIPSRFSFLSSSDKNTDIKMKVSWHPSYFTSYYIFFTFPCTPSHLFVHPPLYMHQNMHKNIIKIPIYFIPLSLHNATSFTL